MEWKQQYFIWNNQKSFETGIYYSELCDSRQKEMEWDRLVLEGVVSYPKEVHISVYCSETEEIRYHNQVYPLQDFLSTQTIPIEEKDQILQPYRKKELWFQEQQLLHGIRGRFLWLRIQWMESAQKEQYIHKIQVFFPKLSWTRFLPAIYQDTKDTFLERYLEIFQVMYQEMDCRIEEIPRLYCSGKTPMERLLWLSQWIGIEEPELWKEEQLRYLVGHGMELANIRGTTEYLKRMLWLYTGVVPFVVEYWHWAYEDMDSRRKQCLENLYGDNSSCVTVILEEQAVENGNSIGVMERLATNCSPAHIDTRVEILQPYIFLDRHSYLGINSRLGSLSDAVLDGQTFLPFVVLKEKEKVYEGI